jgi:hypothetical protein
VGEALQGDPAPRDVRAKVQAALVHYEGELTRAGATLAEADAELAAARDALAPLEAAWIAGAPEPGAPPPEPLPPGHFRLTGRPWPRLEAARYRKTTAETTWRLAAEAVQIAQQQVDLRRGVLARLAAESSES